MNLSDYCRLYVRNGLKYENGEDTELNDETWDQLSRYLLKNYKKLPKWFSSKISENELITGSAAEFSKKFLRDTF